MGRGRRDRSDNVTITQLGGVQVVDPSLITGDDPFGEVLLLGDQHVDPLLDRAHARELADLHVLALADPERRSVA